MEPDIEQSAPDFADSRTQPVSPVPGPSTTALLPYQKPHPGQKGRPSVIASYCNDTIARGDEECIWFCMQRGRKWIAKDVHPTTEAKRLGIDELRRHGGWWKRYSMFSAVGVKEVNVCFRIQSLQKGQEEYRIY
jgi:hypothetical protein